MPYYWGGRPRCSTQKNNLILELRATPITFLKRFLLVKIRKTPSEQDPTVSPSSSYRYRAHNRCPTARHLWRAIWPHHLCGRHGWGDGRRPWLGAEAAADGHGSRRRQAAAGGGDGEDGAVGLREGERNREISQECSSGGARILQLPLRQLLEAAQCLPLPQFALVRMDAEAAGVVLPRSLVYMSS
jgi:hypothetical protein